MSDNRDLGIFVSLMERVGWWLPLMIAAGLGVSIMWALVKYGDASGVLGSR